ncbi:hypothetical protein [Streptomyces sp. NBC_00453]|uniref:hypothetical protein n=1 Tax=Streptomyces sp. NBC_00453 TaxID=2903653 RepID=UPI002E2471A6
MTYRVLGKGPGAVSLAFREDGVELRAQASVINGNDDMKRVLAWVLGHEAPAEGTVSQLGITVEDICRLLAALVPYGVPLQVWGEVWAGSSKRFVEAGR